MSTAAPAEASDIEFEDLLGQWADLESALAVLLLRPECVQGFVGKVRQCDRWLQDLVVHDIDAALYLMFQLASTSTVGYSASHALVSATLCHILAQSFNLPGPERDSLIRAAFTMNIGMTALQDELAVQREPISAQQRLAVSEHPQRGVALLDQLHVADELWLDVVSDHHKGSSADGQSLLSLTPAQRLTRILGTIDRYAAMISPRQSRVGRSATDSVRAIVGQDDQRDEVGLMLVRTVGLCPPGTFVRLDNGDTAIVLRRSERANFPLVASLMNSKNELLRRPALYHTVRGTPRIQAALARSAVTVEPSHLTMVRLGLYAARRTKTVVS